MNNRSPFFTVITVTYNAAAFIQRTLQSVQQQTYTSFEYIIVDGASKDNTVAICRQCACVTQIISEPDRGLYDAMNKGIALAQGDYICFLNAGDQLKDEHTFQTVAQQLLAADDVWPDVIYGETEIVDEQGHFVRMRRLQAPEILNWRSFREGMLVCHQAFWTSCSLAKQESYDLRYRFSADVDWCIRIMRRSQHLMNTHTTLIRYLDGGMSIQNHRASLLERFRIMAYHYGTIRTLWQHAWFVIRALIRK